MREIFKKVDDELKSKYNLQVNIRGEIEKVNTAFLGFKINKGKHIIRIRCTLMFKDSEKEKFQ